MYKYFYFYLHNFLLYYLPFYLNTGVQYFSQYWCLVGWTATTTSGHAHLLAAVGTQNLLLLIFNLRHSDFWLYGRSTCLSILQCYFHFYEPISFSISKKQLLQFPFKFLNSFQFQFSYCDNQNIDEVQYHINRPKNI